MRNLLSDKLQSCAWNQNSAARSAGLGSGQPPVLEIPPNGRKRQAAAANELLRRQERLFGVGDRSGLGGSRRH